MDNILMDDLYTNKPKTTLVKSNENLVDGDIDSAISDLTRSDEDLKFIDAFDAISKKNSEDKIRMMKKIKTNYKLSKESLSYSIESYCDTEIQSLEGEFTNKIKDSIIAAFKKIGEFVKRLIEVFTTLKFRGKAADKIKYILACIHRCTNDIIGRLYNVSNYDGNTNVKINLLKERLDTMRKSCLEILNCYKMAYRLAKKSGKFENIKKVDDVVETDKLEQLLPGLSQAKKYLEIFYNDAKNLEKENLQLRIAKTSVDATDIRNIEKQVKDEKDALEQIIVCKGILQKKLSESDKK